MKRTSTFCGLLLGLGLLIPMGIYAEVMRATVDISSFHDGLAIVKISEHHDLKDSQEWVEKQGAIDKTGEWVIKPRADLDFTITGEFREGMAAVIFNKEKWGYVDHNGQWVFDPQFESASNFSEGLARVKLNGKYGIIDLQGKWVFKPQFDDVGPFKDGLALVRVDGGAYGYMDRDGKWVIRPQFLLNNIEDFSDGVTKVKLNGKWGYMDHTGKLVIQPQFEGYLRPGAFREGLAFAQISEDGVTIKSGYIDHKGKWVIKPRFGDASNFNDGLANVELNGSHGYIDHKGKWVIKPQYVYANDFSEGLAKVGISDEVVNEHGGHDTHVAFIDRNGKVIISTEKLKTLVEPYVSSQTFKMQ